WAAVPPPFDVTGLSPLFFSSTPGTPPPPAAPFAVASAPIMPWAATGDPAYARLGARPGFRARSTLRSTGLAILQPHPKQLDVAGVTAEGVVFWAALAWHESHLETRATASATTSGGYAAAAFGRPNLLAAVSETRIDWYRGGAGRLTPWRTTRLDMPGVVACHPRLRTQELMVVQAHGEVVCLPVP